MVLPDAVKSHPVASILVVLFAAGIVGFTAYTYTQGTFVDDQGCAWTAFENPNGGNFTSKQQVYDHFDERGKTVPDGLELREQDGVVYQRISGGCGSVGGEIQ